MDQRLQASPFPGSCAMLLVASTSLLRADSGEVWFETEIRPLLAQHCYECHSEDSGKRKGGLWLDRREGWALGGDSGPALIPGDPAASLLLRAVRYHDPGLEMPPKGRLPADAVAALETWIARGAPDPRNALLARPDSTPSADETRDFWSFQPLAETVPPAGSEPGSSPVDAWIESGLATAGLQPAPPAEPHDLLRRVYLDLTGLPPTPEAQEAFVADPSETRFAAVVDELLASRAFAERWGRHWLDIVRYADSSGGGRAMPLPDAWRFRDYVIDSFHRDQPLDQTVREHLAGDLLPAATPEARARQLTATGFLVLGPHNFENQNKDLLDLEIVDEQLDTLGRAFLGMTIGCARCHDHKFDPIPIRDYYALAGIFLSTTSVRHSNVSRWQTATLPPSPDLAAALEAHRQRESALSGEVKRIKAGLARLGSGSGGTERAVSAGALPGLVIDDTEAEFTGTWEISSHSPR